MPPKIEKKMFYRSVDAKTLQALRQLLSAAIKTQAFLDDLSRSNSGYMSRLVLQDYANWNEAMMELPAAIKKAKEFQ